MYFVIRNFVTLETLNMRLKRIEFKNDLIPKINNKYGQGEGYDFSCWGVGCQLTSFIPTLKILLIYKFI